MYWPRVTVGVVTENRPEFMEFLAFCFNRLEWNGEKELAVVTTSGNEDSLKILERLIHKNELNVDASLQHYQTVGSLRNRVREIATGEWVTWADDDDWMNPKRLRDVWEAIEVHPFRDRIKVMAMAADVPLLHLGNMRVKSRPRGVWWAGGFVHIDLVKEVRFLSLNVSEDGPWFIKVCRTAESRDPKSVQRMSTHGDMVLCLEHGRNISVGEDNDETKYWPMSIPDWLDDVSLKEIYRLRDRLDIHNNDLTHRRS